MDAFESLVKSDFIVADRENSLSEYTLLSLRKELGNLKAGLNNGTAENVIDNAYKLNVMQGLYQHFSIDIYNGKLDNSQLNFLQLI